MAWKEISAICLTSIVIMLALPAACALTETLSNLKSTVSSFDDPRMDAKDLAFYMDTHGFDATPKGSYVEVDVGGNTYRLTPNGSVPGLCTITI
jgi:hypothetical protein